jgi:hypothetical protein
MTLEEAKANIGKPFKWLGAASGAAAQFDVIKGVSKDGTVYGDWLAAHHDDCRLKQDQPEHLKKHEDEKDHDEEAGNIKPEGNTEVVSRLEA